MAEHLLTANTQLRAVWELAQEQHEDSEDTAMCVQMRELLEDSAQGCRVVDRETATRVETILYVEDEAFVRDVASEILRSAGYRVLTATNANEAVRVYEKSSGEVELLVTDVVLPGETGRGLAGRLRRKNPQLSVLFVTGYAEQIGRCEADHDECLPKPFSTGMLLGTVKRLLDHPEGHTARQDLVRHACDDA